MNGRFWYEESTHSYWRERNGVKVPLIGTTRITGNQDKPGLTWWAAGKACEVLGWLNPRKNSVEHCIMAARESRLKIKNMSDEGYCDFLNKAYHAHDIEKKKTADEGKDMHKSLEEFIRARIDGYKPLFQENKIDSFIAWADKNVKRFLFTEICTFSDILNVGGTADWGYEDMQGNYVLGDFKSSESVFYSMYLQCGAYDLQISENGGFTKEGKQIFTLEKPFQRYEIFAFRAGLDKPFITTETLRLRRAFSYAANLYREQIWWQNAIDKKESGIKVFK